VAAKKARIAKEKAEKAELLAAKRAAKLAEVAAKEN
jgi:hypothetical protein